MLIVSQSGSLPRKKPTQSAEQNIRHARGVAALTAALLLTALLALLLTALLAAPRLASAAPATDAHPKLAVHV